MKTPPRTVLKHTLNISNTPNKTTLNKTCKGLREPNSQAETHHNIFKKAYRTSKDRLRILVQNLNRNDNRPMKKANDALWIFYFVVFHTKGNQRIHYNTVYRIANMDTVCEKG